MTRCRWNVLVWPGGTEIGLEIREALGRCKEVRLFSAGQRGSGHAPFAFEDHSILPAISETGWEKALQELIRSKEIDFIYPAHDEVLMALVETSVEIGARVVAPPAPLCHLLRSKRRTYEFLTGIVPVPHLYDPRDLKTAFPLFFKPDCGQGSQHTGLLRNELELNQLPWGARDYLLCEYLPGAEYTVDCFSDREQGLLFSQGRRRYRMRSGITMGGETCDDPRLAIFAASLQAALSMRGAWFFQVRESTTGVLTLLEVGPRVAGTMALSRMQGVNLPLLSLYEMERLPVAVVPQTIPMEVDRCLRSRYRHQVEYDTVYIDLDDTILIRGLIDTNVVRFLYQCVNKNKQLILITRHADDLSRTLARHRLTDLFDHVIYCCLGDEKYQFMTAPHAIFIDDSFRERRTVAKYCGIPTFSPDMVECLIDDRV